jgi:DNA-binding XRE family transcriptional regulator
MMMRRRTLSRNCLDVRDRVQVKVVRKRLKLTDAQLADIIRKTGNSISAISKEARRQAVPLAAEADRSAAGRGDRGDRTGCRTIDASRTGLIGPRRGMRM